MRSRFRKWDGRVGRIYNECKRSKDSILNNKTALGIEFGSTRIKAVLVVKDIIRSHPEAMNGKTVTKTAYGLIHLEDI